MDNNMVSIDKENIKNPNTCGVMRMICVQRGKKLVNRYKRFFAG